MRRSQERSAASTCSRKRTPAVIVHYLLDGSAHQLALEWCQKRIPNVDDENCARLIAVIPGFVLNSVIEYPRFASFPFTRFRTHSEAASRRYDERHMHDETRIGHAGMR